ncbi:hypothetical protein HPB49_004957 [Dermacentor silvarum]|uniref:Uncharacterized protein n=1 Tax=Dermacentor silvarum TaxID=543639 RepID=A0ACB8C7E5_DERSI|nr:hypothetical protein HPB49_004957 [Dermacentor silvarum]
MNLKALKKPELLELANELNIEISERQRKPEIIEAIGALAADDEELEQCLISIKKKEDRVARDALEKQECVAREAKEERERLNLLEMKRIELSILKAQNTGKATPTS